MVNGDKAVRCRVEGEWREMTEDVVLVTFPWCLAWGRSRGRGRCVWMEMVTY